MNINQKANRVLSKLQFKVERVSIIIVSISSHHRNWTIRRRSTKRGSIELIIGCC